MGQYDDLLKHNMRLNWLNPATGGIQPMPGPYTRTGAQLGVDPYAGGMALGALQGGAGVQGAAPGGGQPSGPPTLEQILGMQDQANLALLGQSAQPFKGGESYAPSGNGQYIFTGGSPFPADERAATIQNALALAGQISNALARIKKRKAPTAGS